MVRENKDELFKSEQLVQELRADAERVCVECDQLQNRSTCISVRCKVLVEQLKDKSCRVMFVQKKEECFEVDGIKKKITNVNWT